MKRCIPRNRTGSQLTPRSPSKNGFTLLEVILAVAIMSILIGSIFTITNSSILLSQSVVENQSDHRHQVALETYLETLFLNLPADASLDLRDGENGQQILTIDNPGTYFPSMEGDRHAKQLIASIFKNRDGLLDLKTTWSSSLSSDTNSTYSSQSITLVDQMTSFEWNIYSTTDKEWHPTWSSKLKRPSHIRVTYSSATSLDKLTRTYWIPPKTKVR